MTQEDKNVLLGIPSQFHEFLVKTAKAIAGEENYKYKLIDLADEFEPLVDKFELQTRKDEFYRRT